MRALILFGKKPRLRFISHLDLQRFFQMALNRTGLPIAFSQGFNPHPIMAFASALALGWTSEYEIFDFKLSVPMGKKRTEEAVRAALPVDLPVLGIRLVDDRFPSLMSQVRAAEYMISFPEDQVEAYHAAAERFLALESCMAMRKTKSGEKEIDIRPLAIRLEAAESGLRAVLKLTELDTLKPDLLVRTLAAFVGEDAPEVNIHRTCLYGEKDGTLVPMMEL